MSERPSIDETRAERCSYQQGFPLQDPQGLRRHPGLSTMPSSGSDFIRRQTLPKRGATVKRVKLTREGNWVNEYPVPRPVSSAIEGKYLNGRFPGA